MPNSFFSIYGICQKNGNAILFDEKNKKYLTSDKTVPSAKGLILIFCLIAVPIFRIIAGVVSPKWDVLCLSESFRLYITCFIIVYICSLFLIFKYLYYISYKKYYYYLDNNEVQLTIEDINKGIENLRECNFVIMGSCFATISALVIYYLIGSFVTFALLLLTIACTIALYVLIQPRKRKRFYSNYLESNSVIGSLD